MITLILVILFFIWLKFHKKFILKSKKLYRPRIVSKQIFYFNYNIFPVLNKLKIFYFKKLFLPIKWLRKTRDNYVGIVGDVEILRVYFLIDKIIFSSNISCKLLLRIDSLNTFQLKNILYLNTMQIDFNSINLIKRYKRNNCLDIYFCLKNNNSICIYDKKCTDDVKNIYYANNSISDLEIKNLKTNQRIVNNFIRNIKLLKPENKFYYNLSENIFITLKELYLSKNYDKFNSVLFNKLLGVEIKKNIINIYKVNDFLKYSFELNDKKFNIDFTNSNLKINYNGIDFYNVHSFKF